jgi:hypothetical protein
MFMTKFDTFGRPNKVQYIGWKCNGLLVVVQLQTDPQFDGISILLFKYSRSNSVVCLRFTLGQLKMGTK